MSELPDLSQLTHDEKDALIRALWAQVQALAARVAELEARLGQFQPAAIEGQEAEPAREEQAPRSAAGQLGTNGWRAGVDRNA